MKTIRLLSNLSTKGIISVSVCLMVLQMVPYAASAQDQWHVRGSIHDLDSGAPVASAVVTLVDGSTGDTLVKDVRSNARGRFDTKSGTFVGTGDVPVSYQYMVADPHPNPVAGGSITIRYSMPSEDVSEPVVELYDVLGRRVDNAPLLSAGLYFYRLQFGNGRISDARSVVVVRNGPLDLQLERITPDSHTGSASGRSHGIAGKTAAGTMEVRFVVEKLGFRTLEASRTISTVDENEVNLELVRDPDAGKARLIVAVKTPGGDVLPDVRVQVVNYALEAYTNIAGETALDSVHTGVPLTLKLSKPGYAEQFRRVEVPARGRQLTVNAVMRTRDPSVMTGNAEQGFSEAGREGIRVEIPAGGLVDADGNPVSGPVSLSMTPVDVSDPNELGAFPGSFIGFDDSDEQGTLVTFGVGEFRLEQNGRRLDLAPGHSATIDLPLYVTRNLDGSVIQEGDDLPLWSLDEGTGLWQQEGVGTVVASSESPTGFAVRGEISHFSWWNLDKFAETTTALFRALVSEPLCKFLTQGWGYMDGGACVMPPLGTLPPGVQPPLKAAISINVSLDEPGFPPMRGSGSGELQRPDDGVYPPPPSQIYIFVPVIVFEQGSLDFPVRFIVCWFESEPVEIMVEDPATGEKKPKKFKLKAEKELEIEPGVIPEFDIEFQLEPIETGGDNELVELPADLERALDTGATATYLFQATSEEVLFLDICRPFGSEFTGMVLLRSPSGLALDLISAGEDCGRMRVKLPENGVYTIRIDNTGGSSETYALELESLPYLRRNATVEGTFDQGGKPGRYVLSAEAGELINVAYGSDETEGRVDLALQTIDSGSLHVTRLTTQGNFVETRLTAIPEDALYLVLAEPAEGVTGSYVVAFTDIEDPVPFDVDSDFVVIEGELDLPGRHDFYRFEGNAGTWHAMVMDRTDAQTRLSVREPGDALNNVFAFKRTVGNVDFTTIDPFMLPESGQWVLEVASVDANVALGRRTGTYEVQIFTPVVEDLVLDSTYAGHVDRLYGFDVYELELADDETINIWANRIGSGVHRVDLFDSEGERLAFGIPTVSGEDPVIEALVPAGTYYVIYDPRGAHTLEYTLRVGL